MQNEGFQVSRYSQLSLLSTTEESRLFCKANLIRLTVILLSGARGGRTLGKSIYNGISLNVDFKLFKTSEILLVKMISV